MPTASLSTQISVEGTSISATLNRTGDAAIAIEPEAGLLAGQAGSLTTKTDEDTGVATLGEDHGIQTADKVDVYWTGGKRYGMDATVDGNDVTIDLGDGDNLPDQDTAVVVCKRQEADEDFDGDDLDFIAVYSSKRAIVEFTEDDDTSILVLEIPAGEFWFWDESSNYDNPLTGDPVGKIKFSNGDTAAGTITIVGLKDTVS